MDKNLDIPRLPGGAGNSADPLEAALLTREFGDDAARIIPSEGHPAMDAGR